MALQQQKETVEYDRIRVRCIGIDCFLPFQFPHTAADKHLIEHFIHFRVIYICGNTLDPIVMEFVFRKFGKQLDITAL